MSPAPFFVWALVCLTSMPCVLSIQLRAHDGPTDLNKVSDEFMTKVWQKMAEGDSPWKPMAQSANEERNICIGGKQVPDFYVLGVQKCATSSLASNLMDAGMSNVHGDLNPKEFHWFDHRMDYSALNSEIYNENKKEWLSWMPECLTDDPMGNGGTRNVLADFTPDYLRLVPRPTEFAMDPEHEDWEEVQELDLYGPKKMMNMYGVKRASKLNFALMLREPLSQMQSAWYHAASFNFTNACKSCKADSFKDALAANLAGLDQQPPVLTPWQWVSMYGRQLEVWMEYYNASQFYIIPMGQLTGADKDTVCRDLKQRLDFEADCYSEGVESAHSWSHEHPPVDEDAAELREKFDAFMYAENTRLVEILAKGHAAGMGLANYYGEMGNQEQIREWLSSSWS